MISSESRTPKSNARRSRRTESRLAPALVVFPGEFRGRVVRVYAGGHSSFAVTDRGNLWGWGNNNYGQLGVRVERRGKPLLFVNKPVEIKLPGDTPAIKKVVADIHHTLVLLESGLVLSAGRGDDGRLGQGDAKDRTVFAPIEAIKDEKVVDIACGEGHSLACTAGGDLYAWGSDYILEMLTGQEGDCLTPVKVASRQITDVKRAVIRVSAGAQHSLILARRSLGSLRLNTSNKGKLAEFKAMLQSMGVRELQQTSVDLKEIDSTPEKVVAHKATHAGEDVLVEDTSLDIEGSDVGVKIRWLLDNMKDFVGKQATWKVLLGLKIGNKVTIYEGAVIGKIVRLRGKGGFGFDPVFLPNGAQKTLAQDKPWAVSARYKAIKALVRGEVKAVLDPIEKWDGKWQH